jgi:hypothetical protein
MPSVVLPDHALAAGLEAVGRVARDAVLDEGRPGSDARGGAAGRQNLGQRQRAVVVLGQMHAGPRAAGGRVATRCQSERVQA